MNVKVIQGSRSEKYLAEEWKCDGCGRVNTPTNHLIFDITVLRCLCGKVFDRLIYFCLADVEVNGHSIVPPPKNQGSKEECVAFAFCHGKELNDNVESIIRGEAPTNDKLDPMDLAGQYKDSFPVLPTIEVGLHKLLYIGLLLREFGCRYMNGGQRSKISDFFTIPQGNVQIAWEMIADGRAVVVIFVCSDAFGTLQFGDVYDPLSVDHPNRKGKMSAHAVLQIGAINFGLLCIDIFLNSHGEQFCALRNAAAEIVIGGIGMVMNRRYCCPVVICRSWEHVLNGRLEGSWNVDASGSETDQMYSSRAKRGLNDILGGVPTRPAKEVDSAQNDNMAGVNVSAAMPSLVVAATHGLADCIKCLLEAGADPNIPDDIGRLPIEIAAMHGWRECAEILFPLTSRVDKYADWSIDGILKRAENDGSVQGDAAFHGQHYPRALALYIKDGPCPTSSGDRGHSGQLKKAPDNVQNRNSHRFLEMISTHIGLRTDIGTTELLIFSSKLLTEDNQRFQEDLTVQTGDPPGFSQLLGLKKEPGLPEHDKVDVVVDERLSGILGFSCGSSSNSARTSSRQVCKSAAAMPRASKFEETGPPEKETLCRKRGQPEPCAERIRGPS